MLDGHNNVLDIDHLAKNGEVENNNVFIGINERNIFQFDPCNHENEIIKKSYTTNPKFSCFSTTKEGHIAIGSESGDIRMYRETGQNAKNLISEPESNINPYTTSNYLFR